MVYFHHYKAWMVIKNLLPIRNGFWLDWISANFDLDGESDADDIVDALAYCYFCSPHWNQVKSRIILCSDHDNKYFSKLTEYLNKMVRSLPWFKVCRILARFFIPLENTQGGTRHFICG